MHFLNSHFSHLLNIWQPVYLSFCQQCFQIITPTHERTCPLCICIADLSRNPMHLLYALHIASTAMVFCIINTNLPTRDTFTVHPYISISLPWACHFSYPHSLIVRHVKVLQAHKKKLYTAAAALLMYALLARQPTLQVFVACDPAPSQGHCAHVQGACKLQQRLKSQQFEQQGQNSGLEGRLGWRFGMVLQLHSFPMNVLYFLQEFVSCQGEYV